MKHLRVLMAGANIHQNLTDVLKSKVVVTDRFVITKDNFEKVSLSLSYKPLFSPYYVVEVYMNGIDKQMFKDLIKLESNGFVQYIFLCTSMKDFDQLEKVSELEILTYNGYNPPDKVMYNYMQSRLGFLLTEPFYKEIRNRLRGNYSLLDSYLDKLNLNPPSDMKELKKIVPALNKTGLWRFFTKLMEREDKKTVFKVVSDYEFGAKFLLEYIQDSLEGILNLYSVYKQGRFNERTLTDFATKNKDLLKKVGLKEYQLQDVLNIYKQHSFAELIILKETIDKGIQLGKEIGYSYSMYQTVTELMNIRLVIYNQQKGLNQE